METNLVIGHCERIVLSSAIFKVSEKGLMRIRKKKRKEVVAMVVGSIVNLQEFVSYKGRSHGPFLLNDVSDFPDQLFFDPYKWKGFVNGDGNIVEVKNYVEIYKSGLMRASIR